MRIINEARLHKFVRKQSAAGATLLRWAAVAKAGQWQSLKDLRNTFRSADPVCECTVFDLLGNSYRLITRIHYADQTITLYHLLTHKEYDRKRWQKDCDC